MIVSTEEWQLTSRNDARTSGSRSPETIARMIFIPVTPVMSDRDATDT
ncbi:hypothetical protein [Rhizobium sp. Root1220]